MAEESTPGNEGGDTGTAEFTPIESQEQFDRMIADRIERAKRSVVPDDLDDLRAKAQRLDEIEQANKSEQERLADELAEARSAAEQSKAEALRFRIASQHGISDEDAELFLTGSDAETLERQAGRLAERVDQRKRNNNQSPREGVNPAAPEAPERAFVRDLFGTGG